MRYAKLGDTGIEVSRMALGCWPFAGGRVWGPQDDDDSIAAVHASLDAGVNFFDTAEGYSDDSNSEEVLGRALEGRRDEAIIGYQDRQRIPTSFDGRRTLRSEFATSPDGLH